MLPPGRHRYVRGGVTDGAYRIRVGGYAYHSEYGVRDRYTSTVMLGCCGINPETGMATE